MAKLCLIRFTRRIVWLREEMETWDWQMGGGRALSFNCYYFFTVFFTITKGDIHLKWQEQCPWLVHKIKDQFSIFLYFLSYPTHVLTKLSSSLLYLTLTLNKHQKHISIIKSICGSLPILWIPPNILPQTYVRTFKGVVIL